MKKLYTLLIALLFIGGALGQGCLPDGITFETQAQIDSFQILYPNCTEIEGDVVISGDDITNLNGLNSLISIGGRIWIGNNAALSSLAGLENVTSVGGNLDIYNNAALSSLSGLDNVISIGGALGIGPWGGLGNPSLTSLTGLDNLTSVGEGLEIWGNDALTSLTGLDNVTSVGGDLDIWWNAALTSLSGLDNVTSVGGVFIANNAALSSLTGLDNVTSVGDGIGIWSNDVLTSLTGLENVTSVGGDLWIHLSDALTSLTGLDSVTFVGGDLWIEGNGALTSLTGLDNVTSVGGDLYIYGNQLLSSCAILSICNYLDNPNGIIVMGGNTTGCDSPEEVQDSCEAHAGLIDISFIVDKLLIYPNPTHSTITIELPTQPSKNTFLTISNTNGHQLITQPINEPQTEIDISHLPVGIYIVKVWNDKEVLVKKVIKR